MSDTMTTPIPDGLMAMTSDFGHVVTLLKRDDEHGAVLRLDGEWQPLLDPRVLDSLSFVGVADSAVDTYDRFLAEDRIVTLGHYVPSPDGPFWPHPIVDFTDVEIDEGDEGALREGEHVEGDEEATEEPSGVEDEQVDVPVTASVIVNGLDDLPLAIAAALRDENLRWYVERRIEALGLEAVLPWSKD